MKKNYYKFKLADLLLNEGSGFYADEFNDSDDSEFEDEDDSKSIYKLDDLFDSKNFMSDNQINDSEFKQINQIGRAHV